MLPFLIRVETIIRLKMLQNARKVVTSITVMNGAESKNQFRNKHFNTGNLSMEKIT